MLSVILQLSILSLCFRLSQNIEESNGGNTQNGYRCFVLGNPEIVQPFRNEKSVRDLESFLTKFAKYII